MIRDIPEFYGLNCTINTTEDCNLRCKYCYETCKKPNNITLDKCYKFVDLVLEDEDPCNLRGTDRENIYDARVFDFIGGDSLMDVKLLEKVFEYINTKVGLLPEDKKLPGGWKASISTNGTLFEKKEVRDFCEKWKDNLSLGVSIDGCTEIHDKNRVFVDGRGTMETIMKWQPWYKKTFPSEGFATKATCNRESIPFLYESLVFMHETLGLRYIRQNFIMEDMHLTEDDIKELDRQLELCSKYTFDHRHEMHWTMIDQNFSRYHIKKNSENEAEENDFYHSGRCGSGCMPALSIDGYIYPCFRWLPHTQNGTRRVMCVGNIDEGFSHKESFVAVQKGSIRANCTREQKCLECEWEPACPYCIGGCYAEHGDFIRTTHNCEVTKLQGKWATWYWEKIREYEGTDDYLDYENEF